MTDTNSLLARRAFDHLLPDTEERRRLCEILQNSASVAAETSAESWTLTVHKNAGRISLNVGRLYAISITSKSVSLILDIADGDSPEAVAVESTVSGNDWQSSALDGVVIRDFSVAHVLAHWDEIKPYHKKAVTRAAGMMKRTNTHWAHLHEAVAVAEEASGRQFPENPFPGMDRSSALVNDKARTRFKELYSEFAESWAETPAGNRHTEIVEQSRRAARENYEALKAADARGGDITDQALLHLLPYRGSEGNRERGAWIGVAPAVTRNVREWFEGSGWARPGDWPEIARALWKFVQTCIDDPEQLAPACEAFVANPVTKGMQTGMLSPILNALAPNHFLTVNNKSRRVINILNGFLYKQGLQDYPACNATGFAIIEALEETLTVPSTLCSSDRFDTFCHWLVAVRKYELKELRSEIWGSGKAKDGAPAEARYFKIAPGEKAARWEEFRDQGCIGIGWDEIGDIRGLSLAEFRERRNRIIEDHPDWTKVGTRMVWDFSRIRVGDIVVANRGTSSVVGIGRVTGPYYYADGERHAHRLPVEWFDTRERAVSFPGWRRTLLKLSDEDFEKVRDGAGPSGDRVREGGPDSGPAFTERTFEILQALHERPEKETYEGSQEDFRGHVQEPLRDLFRRVRDRLPARVLSVVESDRHNFSRILKNDYGRGGAWDHYWAAFYPKGGRRAQDARLTLGLQPSGFIVGFYVGDIGAEEQKRVLANVKEHRSVVESLLGPAAAMPGVQFGVRNDQASPDLTTWLSNPEEYALNAQREYTIPEATTLSAHQLIEEATAILTSLFPLLVCGLERNVEDLLRDLQRRPLQTATSAVTPVDGAPFTSKTFELLERLHHAPKKETYQEAKEDFQQHVEQPFQELFRRVRDLLPESMRARLETESGVFSKFLKNDYGRGGAWDFYWGAFYPPGGKRITDPQLFVWLNHRVLDVGFYIGTHGTEKRKRFLRTVRSERELLRDALGAARRDATLSCGSRDASGDDAGADFDTWLSDPAAHGIRAAGYLDRNTLLTTTTDDLARQIADRFESLYPLFLSALDVDIRSEIGQFLGEEDDDELQVNPPYAIADVANETFLPEDELARWTRAIARKRQAVFYGPPGTGKTYVAKALAKHLVAGGRGRVDLVQFHPSYAYEDFMQGIRPETTPDGQVTYEMVRGRFLEFCEQARALPDDELSVLIIDEVNRANLSRVFGELMYLLEYREDTAQLAGGRGFSIPANVRLLGTMNTADRSIALVDHALRRRFAFIEIRPVYEVLTRYHGNSQLSQKVAQVLSELNRTIGDPNYEVGVSFFLSPKLETEIEDVWRMEIEPYLAEFFFNQPKKLEEFRWDRVRGRLQT